MGVRVTIADDKIAAGLYRSSITRLPPVDWYPAPPDFVGIGIQKAGTAWWYRMVEAHPQVFTRHWQKERQYFSPYGHLPFDDDDAVRYAELFYRPRGGKSGEWTPDYMSDFWVAPLLKRSAPDAKLLVLLRDPVARYASGVRHVVNRQGVPLRIAERDAFLRGFYFDQLRRYLAHFPVEQILVLQYENCVRDPRAEIARTYEFLELEPFVPPNIDVRYNESKGERFVPPAHVEDALVHEYGEDVRQLAATFASVDLARWPRFA